MIYGGNATVFVSDMDRALKFYTGTLGMKLMYAGGGEWASIDAGKGFVIGLHLTGEGMPKPGSRGAISIGLDAPEPLDGMVARLTEAGVHFDCPIIDDGPVRLAPFSDPDGNELYFCEYKPQDES
ncbi:MAG TPA: VOC family protein [candidate division Zixibacteria bacterium]|jgi:catechol 2,3-dioxygenase-like lactoylglutathione lyase family enzyme